MKARWGRVWPAVVIAAGALIGTATTSQAATRRGLQQPAVAAGPADADERHLLTGARRKPGGHVEGEDLACFAVPAR
jgi:hypothetical protein